MPVRNAFKESPTAAAAVTARRSFILGSRHSSRAPDAADALPSGNSRRRSRRPARAPLAHALPRRAAAHALVHRHQPRLSEEFTFLLGEGFRLAGLGSEAQRLPAEILLPIGK